MSGDPLLAGARLHNTSNTTELLLHAVAVGAVKGRVLFTQSSGKGEPHTLPTVLTLCGIHQAVAVNCSAEDSAPLCAPALANAPVLFDARGRWPDAAAATTSCSSLQSDRGPLGGFRNCSRAARTPWIA